MLFLKHPLEKYPYLEVFVSKVSAIKFIKREWVVGVVWVGSHGLSSSESNNPLNFVPNRRVESRHVTILTSRSCSVNDTVGI